jgi:hypothetical protein
MSAVIRPFPQAAGGAGLETIDQLLRDPRALLERIDRGEGLATLARAMILTIAGGCALFGAAMGAHRLGIQVLFAAVKLPLVVLATAVVASPALTALNSALDRPADLRKDLARVLASMALGSLVLAALAPIVLLAVTQGVQYQGIALLVVMCSLVAGAIGSSLLLRALFSSPKGVIPVAAVLLAVYAVVGSQMTWTLRPWLLRPRTEGVPFVRSLDGSLLDSVMKSLDSARGVYDLDEMRMPSDAPDDVERESWPRVRVAPQPDTRAAVDGIDVEDSIAMEEATHAAP